MSKTTSAGFVALAGRPNVGKSTLVNAIVGSKIAIVSDKPQTTRRAIRGIAMRGDAQLVLVDLPGVQRPRDALTQRMQHRVEREFEDADAAVLLLNGEQGVGPGDRFIAAALAQSAIPVAIVVNKIDRLDRARTVATLQAAADLEISDDIFPLSARKGTGVEALVEHLVGLLPESPHLFDVEDASDQPENVLVAELIREQILRRTFQEVPHSVEVVVEEIGEAREDGLIRVQALAWVEAESQKGILIGAQGRMIKAIGTAARRELERHLGTRVHLDLSVRVRRGWRGDDALLDRLGIE
ncbi:MAG: GTPase [Solirubrobacteraceae bacterium]|jgi:GTP-binding protein Era|nr:GTPase [Solirubrobacteraceae bacterium]MEA2231418.1 GTPase [Solirubrobacteraceae bacterium]